MIDYVETLLLPFLACILMSVNLGYVGFHVLKREIIFIDIALAQTTALGAVIAHIYFHATAHSVVTDIASYCATLITAIFFAFVRKKIKQIPLESVIGITYAMTAAGTLFIIGITQGAHTHIQDMLSGSILWIQKDQLLTSFIIYLLVGLIFFFFRKKFYQISHNYNQSCHKDYPIKWDVLFYLLVGINITQSVKLGGIVLVFCFLIIPATSAMLFNTNIIKQFIIVIFTGVASSISGLLFAYKFDFSVGPSIGLFLGLMLIFNYLISKVITNN